MNTTLNPLPAGIPAKNTVQGGFGYVINPINVTVVHKDRATGERVMADAVLVNDLTSTEEIFVMNSEQTYFPPAVNQYTPVLDPVLFTPDTDNYTLEVFYEKIVSTIILYEI